MDGERMAARMLAACSAPWWPSGESRDLDASTYARALLGEADAVVRVRALRARAVPERTGRGPAMDIEFRVLEVLKGASVPAWLRLPGRAVKVHFNTAVAGG